MKEHTQSQTERLYDLLADELWHSTRDLIQKTGITRISARVYDLKHKGWPVESRVSQIEDRKEWHDYRIRPGRARSEAFHELLKLKQLRKETTPKNIEQEGQPKLFALDSPTRL